ncbi:hypothetical protein FRC02_006694, partial [Tulasnella sp. 418]
MSPTNRDIRDGSLPVSPSEVCETFGRGEAAFVAKVMRSVKRKRDKQPFRVSCQDTMMCLLT